MVIACVGCRACFLAFCLLLAVSAGHQLGPCTALGNIPRDPELSRRIEEWKSRKSDSYDISLSCQEHFVDRVMELLPWDMHDAAGQAGICRVTTVYFDACRMFALVLNLCPADNSFAGRPS